MSDNPVLERAERFLSALRHCQVLGMSVHAAKPEAAFFKVVVASTVFFMPPLPARAVPVPG